nr:TPA_inf: conotoxin precursor Cerm03 [Conus ebraeus]
MMSVMLIVSLVLTLSFTVGINFPRSKAFPWSDTATNRRVRQAAAVSGCVSQCPSGFCDADNTCVPPEEVNRRRRSTPHTK